MFKKYDHTNLIFSAGDRTFKVLNLVSEHSCRVIPNHTHGGGSYEIHYICDGYGRARISGQDYELSPGTLYVVGPSVEHSQSPYPEDHMREYCIHLHMQKKKLSQNLPADKDMDTLLSIFEQTHLWFGVDTQNIFPSVYELFQAVEKEKTGFRFEAEALLRQILVRVIRNYLPAAQKKNEGTEIPAFDKNAVTIEEYFLYEYQNLSLEELSTRLGLSPRQTERLLKFQYGKTFQQKKTQARMSAASMMLMNTSDSISKIAEDVGYSSIEHFSAAFKKYYGTAPTQYRQSLLSPPASE